MKKKKGQISFEFLTTYSWAFILIAVMIAALGYIMLKPKDIIPASCTFSDKLQCTEHRFYQDQLKFSIQNFETGTINITKVECVFDEATHTNTTGGVLIPTGGVSVLECNDLELTPGELYRARVLITYTKQGLSFPTITEGNLVGYVS